MALPKAVQQQIDDADRLVAELNGDKTGVNSETDPNTQPQEPAATVVEPADKTVSQEPAPKQIPEETWEQKYHSFKGMYDAEVPRLHSQVRELNQQVQQLIAENASIKVTKPAEPEKAPSLITEQDKEAFGPDLIDLIERATESKAEIFRQREGELVNEINQLKTRLGDVSERQGVSDMDRFLVGLGQQVPDWKSLNTNPGFLTWLSEVDSVYGLPRQVALTNAHENLDVARVAAIFKAYKALVTPAQAAKPKGNQELQRQVAPTRTRSTEEPLDNQNSRIWSEQEIQSFYNDYRRGLIDADEAVRIEKEIHAAASEGRVR